MRTLKSEWGRESLTVNDEIPTTALRWILGSTHVGTPDEEIVAMVKERIATLKQIETRYTAEQEEQTIAAALWLHHENRAEYAAVMSGTF
jgi:hypothetical protein